MALATDRIGRGTSHAGNRGERLLALTNDALHLIILIPTPIGTIVNIAQWERQLLVIIRVRNLTMSRIGARVSHAIRYRPII